jgi:hypothetical protein
VRKLPFMGLDTADLDCGDYCLGCCHCTSGYTDSAAGLGRVARTAGRVGSCVGEWKGSTRGELLRRRNHFYASLFQTFCLYLVVVLEQRAHLCS